MILHLERNSVAVQPVNEGDLLAGDEDLAAVCAPRYAWPGGVCPQHQLRGEGWALPAWPVWFGKHLPVLQTWPGKLLLSRHASVSLWVRRAGGEPRGVLCDALRRSPIRAVGWLPVGLKELISENRREKESKLTAK